jgi:hypothetical protein
MWSHDHTSTDILGVELADGRDVRVRDLTPGVTHTAGPAS